nr:MAG TPA: hypothetical protein [Bacteriophage sp.]
MYNYSILFCSKNHGFSETRQTGDVVKRPFSFSKY